jgi:signal transduction histidine kinase
LTFLILLVFAIAIGTLTERRLRSDFNSQVAATANDLVHNLGALRLGPQGQLLFPRSLAQLYTSENAAVRLLAQDGTLLRSTQGAPKLNFLPCLPGCAYQSNGYRVETRTMGLIQGGFLFVQYARPLSNVNTTIDRVRLFLLFGVLGGTGLAFAAGALIARRAMAPIAALTAAAREIERTRDPSGRVPMPTSEDEVSELARTLERMLGALADARTETEATLARQREFVADASHELRTPLTSVLANLELLAITLDGEQGEAARSALRSSQRMRRLVADLLLLARADDGRSEVVRAERSRRPLDLADLVIEAAAELEPVSADHVIELDPQPAPLLGARDDLHRLSINLIENAIEHTPPGTHVAISTRTRSDGAVELAVADNGPGIPSNLEPRLFERFVRGVGDSGGSFGLGLAIVRAVTDAHGGSVRVERPETGGARFVVTLPGTTVGAAEPIAAHS